MPWYDYKCPKCNTEHEIFHHAYEDKANICSCQEILVKKISSSPVHFKGSGFYETDYKGK